MKRIIFLTLLSLMGTLALGQNYSLSAGVRLGVPSGISAKYFVTETESLEGIASFHSKGFLLTGLYVFHRPIRQVPDLSWFIGGGAHAGVWDNVDKASTFYLGVDFDLGLEYKIPSVPFTAGIDWKPSINIVGDDFWWPGGGALSFRYIIR